MLFLDSKYALLFVLSIIVEMHVSRGAVPRALSVARAKEAGFYIETPLFTSLVTAAQYGGMDVKYKMENCQPSGSFKSRGIGNMIQSLIDNSKINRLICSSGGNAGMAVATTGEKVGLPVDIYVPITTLPMMIAKLKQKKANVFVFGENWNEADTFARAALSANPLAGYIPPYDDPLIWEGHSSIVDELKASLGDFGRPHAIVLSVGGGGLLAGIQKGLDRVGWNDVRVIAVETEGAASFAAAKTAGEIVKLDRISTIASSLGALSVTSAVLDKNSNAVSLTESLIVSDAEAVDACLRFADEQRSLVEPACGAALAAVYSIRHRETLLAGKEGIYRVVVIVCGGSVVSLDLLQSWKEKFISN
jgi:L-serine/L-threonine ammonia-lyase